MQTKPLQVEAHSNISYQEFVERQQYLTLAEGYKLAYTDLGSSTDEDKVILLVHGVPTSSWLYRHIIENLVERGYRVIAPDLLGYGSSDKPKGYDIYNAERQSQRMLELLKHLSIKRWSQVVHDAGGLWSWPMLVDYQEFINSLVLLNTIASTKGFKPPLKFKPGQVARQFSQLYCSPVTNQATIKSTLLNGISSPKAISHREAIGYWKPFNGANCDALHHFYVNTAQLTVNIPKIVTIPTMVIWGAKDDVLQWTLQKDYIASTFNLSETDHHILRSNKHFIQEESPETLSRLMDNFFMYNYGSK